MMRTLLRHDDEMRVGNSVAMYEIAYALERECMTHPSPELLCDHHDSLRHFI